MLKGHTAVYSEPLYNCTAATVVVVGVSFRPNWTSLSRCCIGFKAEKKLHLVGYTAAEIIVITTMVHFILHKHGVYLHCLSYAGVWVAYVFSITDAIFLQFDRRSSRANLNRDSRFVCAYVDVHCLTVLNVVSNFPFVKMRLHRRVATSSIHAS